MQIRSKVSVPFPWCEERIQNQMHKHCQRMRVQVATSFEFHLNLQQSCLPPQGMDSHRHQERDFLLEVMGRDRLNAVHRCDYRDPNELLLVRKILVDSAYKS